MSRATVDRAGTLARRSAERLAADPPAWLTAARADGGFADLGVTWLSDEDIATAAAEAKERPSDWSKHSSSTLQHTRLNRPHLVPVATGPSYERGMLVATTGAWYVDARDPEAGLSFAPSDQYPPFLHSPAGTSAETAGAALAGYFPDRRLAREELTSVKRGFMGYLENHEVPSPYNGQLEEINGHTLDRYYTMNLYTEANAWGGAYHDDPFPDEPLNMLQMTYFGRRAMAQSPIPSKTWRTVHSGSHVSIEIHSAEVMIAEIRYRPVATPVAPTVNAAFGSTFPDDVPADVIGALLGFDFLPFEHVLPDIAATGPEDPGALLAALRVGLMLAWTDAGALSALRPFFTQEHGGLRVEIYNALISYGYGDLLAELAAEEPDEELAAKVRNVVEEGVQPWHPEAFGDDDIAQEALREDGEG